ncbi:DUF1320 domain-containing protein [Pseudanabaena sp. PCC 6802]|uniref:DUF1320 domain-containing protein n=1 Tax=Pseudanabaena sp. PCC 6802 TaxID=118173 RepID=UPI00034C726F|nr:DUF1320 domain-containing protein [Pseudanabaena sp. PCC 6802]
MGRYATQQDFVDAFGYEEVVQLSNLWDASATEINSANLNRNIADAEAIVDGMIATCPAVAEQMPFADPKPPLLKGYVLDLARRRMDSISAREDVIRRADEAIAQLKLIGACKMSLGLSGATPPVAIETAKGDIQVSEGRGIFAEDFLRGF